MSLFPVAYEVGGEFRRATHIRYEDANVPTVDEWKAQGTVYDSPMAAKYAAAKIYTAYNILGVVVKRIDKGFTLLYWTKK